MALLVVMPSGGVVVAVNGDVSGPCGGDEQWW